MGTRAHWLKAGYRARSLDDAEEPGNWAHSATLAEVREDVLTNEVKVAEVQRYDRRAEHYVPYGTAVRVKGRVVVKRTA
jgi:hypothetical protein